jgi:hypothetical protein
MIKITDSRGAWLLAGATLLGAVIGFGVTGSHGAPSGEL